jgi:hypothetical protein
VGRPSLPGARAPRQQWRRRKLALMANRPSSIERRLQ